MSAVVTAVTVTKTTILGGVTGGIGDGDSGGKLELPCRPSTGRTRFRFVPPPESDADEIVKGSLRGVSITPEAAQTVRQVSNGDGASAPRNPVDELAARTEGVGLREQAVNSLALIAEPFRECRTGLNALSVDGVRSAVRWVVRRPPEKVDKQGESSCVALELGEGLCEVACNCGLFVGESVVEPDPRDLAIGCKWHIHGDLATLRIRLELQRIEPPNNLLESEGRRSGKLTI